MRDESQKDGETFLEWHFRTRLEPELRKQVRALEQKVLREWKAKRPKPWPILPRWMKPIRWHVYRGGFWMRLYKVRAFCVENRRVIPSPFSERERIRRPLRLGRFAIWLVK